MPLSDLVRNSDIAKKPNGGACMNNTNNNSNNCNCNCDCNHEEQHIHGYWMHGCPPPPPPYPPCPPYPPYPYDCPPVGTGVGAIETQIAKLSKKSAIIRKMIDNLVNKNKSIMISIGCGAQYNFGCYLDKEDSETEYGKAILEILTAELEAIKAKIVELTSELEVADETIGGIEGTVTKE